MAKKLNAQRPGMITPSGGRSVDNGPDPMREHPEQQAEPATQGGAGGGRTMSGDNPVADPTAKPWTDSFNPHGSHQPLPEPGGFAGEQKAPPGGRRK